jgi:hypothetical protein
MNYQLLSTDEEGMAVRGPQGFFTVFWEQKPPLVEAGILSVLPDDPRTVPNFALQLHAGEIPGIDRDEVFLGLVRDPALMQIFTEARAKHDPYFFA